MKKYCVAIDPEVATGFEKALGALGLSADDFFNLTAASLAREVGKHGSIALPIVFEREPRRRFRARMRRWM